MTLLFQTQNQKKEYIISLSFSLGVCVCVCVFPFFFSDIWFSLSLSLSLSRQNNERGCDDSFVDVKSVEDLGIAEKGSFFGLKSSRSSFYFFNLSYLFIEKMREKGPFFGLKPSRSGFYFLIFLSFLFGSAF